MSYLSLEEAIRRIPLKERSVEVFAVVSEWLSQEGFHTFLANKIGILTQHQELGKYVPQEAVPDLILYFRKGMVLESTGPLLYDLCERLGHDPVVFLCTPILRH